MTRKYFSQTNLDFRILDIQNTCKKITIHLGFVQSFFIPSLVLFHSFVYYDWLRLINIWAGAPPLWAGPKWADPIGRRAGSV